MSSDFQDTVHAQQRQPGFSRLTRASQSAEETDELGGAIFWQTTYTVTEEIPGGYGQPVISCALYADPNNPDRQR
ncbi:MAG: hypothetical protein R2843_06555 [Thermomicrobiales bacterium]